MNTIMLVAFSFIAGMMVMYFILWGDMQKMRYESLSEFDRRVKTEKALKRITERNKRSCL